VSQLSLESIVAARKEQVSCDLAGEAAILQLESGVYYTLNAVGARVWTLVQQPVRVEAVRDTLLAEYGVTSEQLEADLLDLLTRLAAERLIEVRAADAA
jgi:coenzyme PQQ synthesis protein D (PqqD)